MNNRRLIWNILPEWRDLGTELKARAVTAESEPHHQHSSVPSATLGGELTGARRIRNAGACMGPRLDEIFGMTYGTFYYLIRHFDVMRECRRCLKDIVEVI